MSLQPRLRPTEKGRNPLTGSALAKAPPGERFFSCRLVPPRPGFAPDMTADERAAMQRLVACWTALPERGIALVFGPAADPAGAWGPGTHRTRQAAFRDRGDPCPANEARSSPSKRK